MSSFAKLGLLAVVVISLITFVGCRDHHDDGHDDHGDDHDHYGSQGGGNSGGGQNHGDTGGSSGTPSYTTPPVISNPEVIVMNNSSHATVTATVNGISKSIGNTSPQSWNYAGSFTISCDTRMGYNSSVQTHSGGTWIFNITDDPSIAGAVVMFGKEE